MTIKVKKQPKVTSSRPRAKRLSPEERRIVLLDLGVKAFADNGIGNVVHADIAKAAKVSLPTVFHYFPTKEILIMSILDTVKETILTQVLPHFQSSVTSEKAFIDSSMTIADIALSHPDHTKVWLMWSMIYQPQLRDSYLELEDQFMQVFIKILKGVMPLNTESQVLNDRARLMVGAGIMLTRFALDTSDKQRIEQYVRHVMVVLLHPVN